MKQIRKRLSQTLITTGFLGLGVACSSSDKVALDCQNRDWHELGRQAGILGEDPRADFALACPENRRADYLKTYLQGHHAGLTEYCSPENGFNIGRTGRNPQTLCPEVMESQFLVWHLRGKKAHRLELTNKNLKIQISEILLRLNNQPLKPEDQSQLRSRLNDLESSVEKNTRTLSGIENRTE